MNTPVLIAQEYSSAICANQGLSGSRYYSNAYKDHREWHILGSAQRIFAKSNISFPTHARKAEGPDFHLYDSTGTLAYGMEITTVLPPNYKVHEHHREWEKSGSKPYSYAYPAYSEHWNWLRKALLEKLNMPYISGCSVLVYFDVSIGDTNEQYMDFRDAIEAEFKHHPAGIFGLTIRKELHVRELIVLASGLNELAIVYPGLSYLSF